MFDSLSDRLSGTLDGLRGKGRLSEEDIDRAMREIRLALLEADVNFKVVKEFTGRVKERALGSDVVGQLRCTGGHQRSRRVRLGPAGRARRPVLGPIAGGLHRPDTGPGRGGGAPRALATAP